MTLTTREDIGIAQIAFYIPALLLAAFIAFKHGLHRQLGWLYLILFSIIRVASGIMTIQAQRHPTDENDVTWASILGSIGLSPLLLASAGLAKRVYVFHLLSLSYGYEREGMMD